jgi:hypothetical protein
MFKKGQQVAVKAAGGGDGRMTIAIPATFLRRVGKKLLCKDRSGKQFQINPENVFASMEALEASVSALRVSVNTETGRITTFPANARLRQEGETLWHDRQAGEASAFGNQVPDWMTVPKEVLAYSPGDAKRRIVRQFTHPCPLTGNPVKARELAGGIYCFESPGKGWLFTMRLDPPEGGWKVQKGTEMSGEEHP